MRFLLSLGLLGIVLHRLPAAEVLALPAWTEPRKPWECLDITRADTDGAPALTFLYAVPDPKQRHGSTRLMPWSPEVPADGVRFEVQGDGSTFFGSVVISTPSTGYEALFPLASTTWTTVTLRWSDFILNHHPSNPDIAMMSMTPVPDPTTLTRFGFGFGNPLHKYFPERASFTIRHLAMAHNLPPLPPPPALCSTGFTRTRTALQAKRPLRILLLGDSITDLGGNRSYAFYAGQRLQAGHGIAVTVVNAGIGGATSRYGTIVLPRSLAAMPDPDLVCVMFGANDAKEADVRPDMDAGVFAARLGGLIERVRRATAGKSDIVLLSGVPRLDQDRTVSTGAVERIAPGVAQAAATHQTAFIDTLAAYVALDPPARKPLFVDTIHQSEAGLRFLGDRLYEAIIASPR